MNLNEQRLHFDIEPVYRLHRYDDGSEMTFVAGYRVAARYGDGRYYLHVRELPLDRAEAMMLRMMLGRDGIRPEDSPHWEEVEPVFGSEEWQDRCEEAEAVRERQDAERWM